MSSSQADLRRRLIAGVAAFLLVAVALASTASAEVIDRIVAQVNDEIITEYELEEGAVPYLVQQGQNPQALADDQRREAILEEVLEEKVNRILMEEEAREMGLEVGEAQIDEWIRMTAQQQNMTTDQFRQAVSQYGIEYEEYRQIIRDNLLQMQLMQQRARGGAVSESEIDAAYRERFGSPDGVERRIEVRHILLVPEQIDGGEEAARELAGQLREQIVAGEATFGELAESYSQGPGADDGGNIGMFGRGELAESFESVAFDLEVGELSQPVDTEFGIHLVEVLDSEERADPQVEQRRQQIRAQLQEEQMQQQMESYLETLRTRAFIDIRY